MPHHFFLFFPSSFWGDIIFLKKNMVRKAYLAVGVAGKTKLPNTGVWKSLHPETNTEMVTEYQVLARKYGLVLLRLLPQTGKKHQLRIHCLEAKCPVLGDKRYSSQIPQVGETIERVRHLLKRAGLGHAPHQHGLLMHLHAHELLLPNYFTDGSNLHLVAPLPSHIIFTLNACFSLNETDLILKPTLAFDS
eukprot:m.179724 g.179724  ORF g.179724 m.179724 type:complete len:191 (-) comp16603_c2_seq3:3208-3780(-)